MERRRVYVTCHKCRGTGGNPMLDDETSRLIENRCGPCSGRGEYQIWVEYDER